MIDTSHHFHPYKRGRLFSRVCSQTLPGAVALTLGALFGVWIFHMRPAAAPDAIEAPAAAPAAAPAVVLTSVPNDALFDPSFISGPEPVSIAQSNPIQSSLESNPPAPSTAIAELENVAPMPAPAIPRFGESAPLPLPRPAELGSLESHSPLPAPGRRFAQQNRKPVTAATAADNRTFFEKFFGMLANSGACPCLCGSGRWPPWQCARSHVQTIVPLRPMDRRI